MISGVYILNPKGIPVAVRQYRQQYGEIIQPFIDKVLFSDVEQEEPVFEINRTVYAYIKKQGLIYLATSQDNCDTFLMIEILRQIYTVFSTYFDKVNEETILQHITLIYELLDEAIDFGYPQNMEPDVLKSFIQQKSVLDELMEIFTRKKQQKQLEVPIAATGLVSWRQAGLHYRKNECFCDINENLNAICNSDNKVLSANIKGSIQINSHLSGMPSVSLALNDKVTFDAALGKQMQQDQESELIELENVKLHQCVRLSSLDENKQISFIPPDGKFELLSYNISRFNRVAPFTVNVQETRSQTGFSYNVTVQSNYRQKSTATEVHIQIPVPIDCDTPLFNPSNGVAKLRPADSVINWTIKNMAGKEVATLQAKFGLPVIRSQQEDVNAYTRKPIVVQFILPYYTMSGLSIRYLKCTEKSGYTCTPWCKSISQGTITIKRK